MFVEIENISLREFTEKDIENKLLWINDPENNEYLHYEIPLEYTKTLQWYYNKNNETRRDLVIEYGSVPVGLIGLLNIDKANKKAEYYICLGNKQYKGRGIAKAATKMIIAYAFDKLELNKVYLNVDAENVVACHLYENSGFSCEGYFKKDMVHRGRYIDRKRYAVLAEDWRKLK